MERVYRFFSFLWGVVILVLQIACAKDGYGPDTNDEPGMLPEEGKPASLDISLDAPSVSSLSRSLVGEDAQPVTDWEKAVDGRFIYRLTLLIINQEDIVVGYRDIYNGSPDLKDAAAAEGPNGLLAANGPVDPALHHADQVGLTFNFDFPLHRTPSGASIEKLRTGRYKLIFVANFSDFSADNQIYNGNAEVEGYVQGIVGKFNATPDVGLDAKNNSQNQELLALFKYQQDAGSDFVCAKSPQMLSLVQNVYLQPGENHIAFQLQRTCSRIRIVVENESLTEDLKVKSLSFSNAFAQQKSYLLDDPDKPDRKYTDMAKGAPAVGTVDPIVPFGYSENKPLVLSKLNAKQPENSRAVIFDAYIFESKNNGYSYKIGLEYSIYAVGNALIKTNKLADEFSQSNSKLFLIQNLKENEADTDYFIKAGKDQVECADVGMNPNQILGNRMQEYIWELTKTAKNSYSIKSSASGKYMQDYTSQTPNHVPMAGTQETYFFDQDADVGTTGMCVRSNTYTGNWSKDYRWLSLKYDTRTVYWDWWDKKIGCFAFFPISMTSKSSNKDVPLTVIDPESQVGRKVTEIKRNDFIRVNVGVRYNPFAGDFSFNVKGWNFSDNNIEFN